MDFLIFFGCLNILDSLDFFVFLDIFLIFGFFWIPFIVNKVTTKSYQGDYWTPKIAKNKPKQHNKLFFCLKGKKSLGLGRTPPQELEVGPLSGPYLLVSVKWFQSVQYSLKGSSMVPKGFKWCKKEIDQKLNRMAFITRFLYGLK